MTIRSRFILSYLSIILCIGLGYVAITNHLMSGHLLHETQEAAKMGV